MKYVIVGSGVAAIAAVEGIRKFDARGKILMVTEEDVPVDYSLTPTRCISTSRSTDRQRISG